MNGLPRPRITTCLAVVLGGGALACASVIGIGEPQLDTEEAGTVPVEASVEASVERDTSTPPRDGAPPPADTGPRPPGPGEIACGGANCSVATMSCCVYYQSPTASYQCSADCRPPDTTAGHVTALKCARPSDCSGGMKCCLTYKTYSSTTSEGSTACKLSCSQYELTMCDPGGPNTCGSGSSCKAASFTLPSKYGTCI